MDLMVFSDERLTSEEVKQLRTFFDVCVRHQEELASTVDELPRLALEAGVNYELHYKECVFMQGIWYIYLSALKAAFDQSRFKYQTVESFLQEYPMFKEVRESEQFNLFHTANWMVVLFSLVSAKKSKGLAILVIPKLVEGWGVKYITGSGQKKQTCNRVYIYEHEGKVKPHARGKHLLKERAAAAGAASAEGNVSSVGERSNSSSSSSASSSSANYEGKAKKASKNAASSKLLTKSSMNHADDHANSVLMVRKPQDRHFNPGRIFELNSGIPSFSNAGGGGIVVCAAGEFVRHEDVHRVFGTENYMMSAPLQVSGAVGSMGERLAFESKSLTESSSATDPLLLAFPNSLSSANFDLGILSRDVSRVLKSGNLDCEGLDMTKLGRFTSANWGDFELLSSPKTTGTETLAIDALFM